MQKEAVDEMLRSYNKCAGRCGFLECMIKHLRQLIQESIATAEQDVSGIGAMNYDGMPHSTTPGNPTQDIGIQLACGHIPNDAEEDKAILANFEAEYRNKIMTVRFVDAWLKGLSEREEWMIRNQIMDGLTYRELADAYMKRFGSYCSKDTLRRLRKNALNKIYEMAA